MKFYIYIFDLCLSIKLIIIRTNKINKNKMKLGRYS